MSERVIHPNDNAKEQKPALWFFSGRSLYVLLGGIFAGYVLYQCFSPLLTQPVALVIAIGEIALAILYVVALMIGKPRSYHIDFWRSGMMRLLTWLSRLGFGPIRIELQRIQDNPHPLSLSKD
jgi:hypothetical protein